MLSLVMTFLMFQAHAVPVTSDDVGSSTLDDDRDVAYRTTRWFFNGQRTLRIRGIEPTDALKEAERLARLELSIAAELNIPRERVWSAVDGTAFASGADIFHYPSPDNSKSDAREPVRFGTGVNEIITKFYAGVAEFAPVNWMKIKYARFLRSGPEPAEEPRWREAYWENHPLVARAETFDPTVDPTRFSAPDAAAERRLAWAVRMDPDADPKRFAPLATDFERTFAAELGVSEDWLWEAASFWLNPARARAWTWIRRFPSLPPELEVYYWRGLARISPRVHDSLRAEQWRLNSGDSARVDADPGLAVDPAAPVATFEYDLLKRVNPAVWANARTLIAREKAFECAWELLSSGKRPDVDFSMPKPWPRLGHDFRG